MTDTTALNTENKLILKYKTKRLMFLKMISNFLLKKSFLFWALQMLIGYFYWHKFVGDAGMVLTIVVPNITYLFVYFPYFTTEPNYSNRQVIFECIFCVVSTIFFWSYTVNAYNWKESGLIVIYVFPALIAMSIFTAIKLKVKIINPKSN